jgi:hypothetical protein
MCQRKSSKIQSNFALPPKLLIRNPIKYSGKGIMYHQIFKGKSIVPTNSKPHRLYRSKGENCENFWEKLIWFFHSINELRWSILLEGDCKHSLWDCEREGELGKTFFDDFSKEKSHEKSVFAYFSQSSEVKIYFCFPNFLLKLKQKFLML